MRNALRMRPDRIIIGECRGPEALDMLQAMNTGHEGSLTTIHANAPRDAVSRLETMISMGGIDIPLKALRHQFASAVDLIIQANRLAGRPAKGHAHHRSAQHGAGHRDHAGHLPVRAGRHRRKRAGRSAIFKATGVRPAFMDRLESAGVRLPANLFAARQARSLSASRKFHSFEDSEL